MPAQTQLLPSGFYPVLISGIRFETGDVKTFTLAKDIPYKAGQFLTLLSPNGKERRSYSFSSEPGTDRYPAITVKRVQNGLMSRYLFDVARPGDALYISDPSGFFVLPENIDAYEQVFFMAAGIGITPVFSLIKALLLNHPHIKVTLIYSSRSITGTVFYDELQLLAEKYKTTFRIEYLFSTAADLSHARLNKLLLPRMIDEYLYTDRSKALFYICGPFVYMRMVLLALEEAYIPAENIKKENFNTAVIQRRSVPPDTGSHHVSIQYKGKQFRFASAYPDTILSSAQKHGIALPYSCGNGICGTCAALCTSGKVWHRNNEVLTGKELKSGLVLTCTGYPVDGDVTLEIN
jgi:ferredoxin-NADP reductase